MRSRRTLSLRFDIPTERTRAFWEALKVGRLVTTRCSACGAVSFPPQADCPKCMASAPQWVDLPREASLATFTRVEVAPASFDAQCPYTIGIGMLANGLRVLAWIEGVSGMALKPGMKLTLEARTSPDGYPYYVFVPVQNSA